MFLSKRKQTKPPESDLDASVILELLIHADSCLEQASGSAMAARAYTLSANLCNARCRIIEQIYSLMHDRKQIVSLMTPAAQDLFRQFMERSTREVKDVEI